MNNSPIIVMKFGSSIFEGVTSVPRAVHAIYRHVQRGERVIAVVSALAGETDQLLGMVGQLDQEADPYRIASFVGTGETKSALLLSITLERVGLTTQLLSPEGIGLIAEGSPLDSDPCKVDVKAIQKYLSACQVAVLPGFIACDTQGRTVLLGRGGSDDTALFVAQQLKAGCRLVKDVDGIFERDPDLPGPTPRRFVTINWSDALEVAGKLVQPKAIKFAEQHQMSFEVASIGTTGGTLVGPGPTHLAEVAHPDDGPLRVALFGAGTVGYGVYQALAAHPERFEIVGIAVSDLNKARETLPKALLTDDVESLLEQSADLTIELMGGYEPARSVITHSLSNSRDVVTANKELMADESDVLEELAHRNGLLLKCSASVGGGLPAIESIRRISANTPVKSIEGVLNGTCNFILDHLAVGWDFDTALKAAQDKGFAEADPTHDLSGRDAASKIRILARTAFGTNLQDTEVTCKGIENISTESAQAARADGRETRLVARCWKEDGQVFAEVLPRELPAEHPLAQVQGENNRLRLELESGEELLVSGKGAGRWPTSESVFADLMEIYRYRIGTKKGNDGIEF
jgi:homoserine dehydrogenase